MSAPPSDGTTALPTRAWRTTADDRETPFHGPGASGGTLREDTPPALAPSKTAGAGTCFVVPTYNGAPNIVPLLWRLTGPYTDPDAAFPVVDDESPDGTGRLVRELAAADGRVRLLEGPRRGFGQAYVRGMT